MKTETEKAYAGELKVGMRVRLVGGNADLPYEMATVTLVDGPNWAGLTRETTKLPGWMVRRKSDGTWGADAAHGDLFLVEDAPASKTKLAPEPIRVSGHIPNIVVQIGCLTIPYTDARKEANRLLKLVKSADGDIVVTYKGHKVTLADVQNFLKWLDQYEKGKRGKGK